MELGSWLVFEYEPSCVLAEEEKDLVRIVA